MQTLALANLFDVPDATPGTTTTPPPVLVVEPKPTFTEWYVESVPKPIRYFWMIARPISFAACVYHGYKRNDSIGWALGWGLLGSFFPIITPTIAVAQGFGKRKSKNGFGRRRRRTPLRGRRSRRTR